MVSKDTLSRDTYLNLVRAHEKLTSDFSAYFKSEGLTSPQYNVLRILRGAPKEGGSCHYIGERLLTRVPDVTRLLDRMEASGLVQRARSSEDRRVVLVRLSTKGRRLCDRMEEPVMALHRKQLTHLPTKTLGALNAGLLEVLASS